MMKLTLTGTLADCLLLSFRTDAKRAAERLPRSIEPITRGGFAFWNVVACRVEKMRPVGVPAALGVSYHHVAYRLLVRAHTEHGERRGLFFVRSDSDSALINLPGNWLTDFRFHAAKIQLDAEPNALNLRVDSRDGRADAEVNLIEGEPELAAGSPFGSIEEARTFLKYPPLALSVAGDELKLARVERDERDWHERAVAVEQLRLEYLDTWGTRDAVLELATRVDPLPYRWTLGGSGGRERLEREIIPRSNRLRAPANEGEAAGAGVPRSSGVADGPRVAVYGGGGR